MAYSKKQIEELFADITNQIAEGKSLRAVLRQKNMPNRTTFYNWLSADKEKINQYARACKEREEMMFEDIISIADSVENDVMVNEEGKEVINHNVIQRDRLRVDARKWALSKMNPKKYSEKQSIEMELTEEKPFVFEIIDGRKD